MPSTTTRRLGWTGRGSRTGSGGSGGGGGGRGGGRGVGGGGGGPPRLLNRQGTTFRKLPEAEKAELDAGRALDLMVVHPSAIRRPVVDLGDELVIGFDAERYATLA